MNFDSLMNVLQQTLFVNNHTVKTFIENFLQNC